MTDKEYKRKLADIQRRNRKIEKKRSLQEEKNKYRKPMKMPATSKLMAFYLFLLLNIVTVYAMVAMWVYQDLSYLGVLITDIAAQILVYFIYSAKSTKENTKGGITYDMAMRESMNEMTEPFADEIENNETGGLG